MTEREKEIHKLARQIKKLLRKNEGLMIDTRGDNVMITKRGN